MSISMPGQIFVLVPRDARDGAARLAQHVVGREPGGRQLVERRLGRGTAARDR